MQNIIIQTGLGANFYIRQALVNAFRAVGYNVYFWDSSGKSPFDLFGEFPCDLFIGSSWQLDRALVKCLSNRPTIKIILWADIWGAIENELDFIKYPVSVATDEQKKLTSQLNKIPYIITNHSSSCVESTHGGWRNLGSKPESVLVSADVSQYFYIEPDKNYEVQLAYVGGYWPYKSRNIDQYLLPLCYPNTKWKIRLFGSGWNTINGIGNITSIEAAKYYRNSGVIPHLVEPHASDVYGDIPLRYFEVPAAGGFGISCPCKGIREVFTEDELVIAENPKDFFDKVVYYLNNPDLTISMRYKAMCKVYGNHTNLHRIKQLLEIINEDSTRVDQFINDVFYPSLVGICYG